MTHEVDYWTVRDWAGAFGVTEKTVYRWLDDDKVDGAWKTPGGQWRLPDPSELVGPTPDPLDLIVEEA